MSSRKYVRLDEKVGQIQGPGGEPTFRPEGKLYGRLQKACQTTSVTKQYDLWVNLLWEV